MTQYLETFERKIAPYGLNLDMFDHDPEKRQIWHKGTGLKYYAGFDWWIVWAGALNCPVDILGDGFKTTLRIIDLYEKIQAAKLKNKLLAEENAKLREQVKELSLVPNGPEYFAAKAHYEGHSVPDTALIPVPARRRSLRSLLGRFWFKRIEDERVVTQIVHKHTRLLFQIYKGKIEWMGVEDHAICMARPKMTKTMLDMCDDSFREEGQILRAENTRLRQQYSTLSSTPEGALHSAVMGWV